LNKEPFNIEHSKFNIHYAGFWIRFLAVWIDTAVLVVPIGFVVYLLSGGEWLDFSQLSQSISLASQRDIAASL
jgi:hypothetical protein